MLGRIGVAYLAYIMGWKSISHDDEYDDEDLGEWVLEDGGECEGGGGSQDFKGNLTINFWVDGVRYSSLYSNNRLE